MVNGSDSGERNGAGGQGDGESGETHGKSSVGKRDMTDARHNLWDIRLQCATLLLAATAAAASGVWVLFIYVPEQRAQQQTMTIEMQRQNADLQRTLQEVTESRKTAFASVMFSNQAAVFSRALSICESFRREVDAQTREPEMAGDKKLAKLGEIISRFRSLMRSEFRLYASIDAYKAAEDYAKAAETKVLAGTDKTKRNQTIRKMDSAQIEFANACRKTLESTSSIKLISLVGLPPPYEQPEEDAEP